MRAMEFARLRYLESLLEPRHYRVGKYTNIGRGKNKRETLVEIDGPGVFKALWTTHSEDALWTTRSEGKHAKVYFYVDGEDAPVLEGLVHELGAAAQRLSCPEIPLGGYFYGQCATLYLPIAFERSLRIEAEPHGEIGGGPFWQIDYALDSEEKWPRPRQEEVDGEMRIAYDFPAIGSDPLEAREDSQFEVIDEDIELSGTEPHEFWLEGGGIIRRLVISGRAVPSLLLRIAFDGVRRKDEPLSGHFQVNTPLRYLVHPFNNACVEGLEGKAIIHFPMPFRERAGIQLIAGMDLGAYFERHLCNIRIEYEKDRTVPDPVMYFHARFRSENPNGYDDIECCSTRGRGHFVGVHIFDTGHDHGGGDNILFDGGADSAGQLHGINGEDYFHHAYSRIFRDVESPHTGCPTTTARYRYHLEMPIPFSESFVFNWGCFESHPAKSVTFWYQDTPAGGESPPELSYTLKGPFPIDKIDDLAPGAALPQTAAVWPEFQVERPLQSWRKNAQCGFVDLCHSYRKYVWAAPSGRGDLPGDLCTCADTRIWSVREAETLFRIGCDDPIRVYLNDELVFADDGRNQPDPFKLFKVGATLQEGLNTIRVVVGNTLNYNWYWHGFSLVLENDLNHEELLYMK